MGTAKVFRSGNSQAVRLPKQFRLKSKEVEIFRRGKEIVLREKDGTMARAFDLLAGLPDDLEVEREKDRPTKTQGALNGAALSVGHKHLHLYSPGKTRSSIAAVPQAPSGRSRALGHHLWRTDLRGGEEFAAGGGDGAVARTLSLVAGASLAGSRGGSLRDIRADLAAKGEMIGNNDLWIAAHALASGLI